jgi:sugar lactone lactonase YvrE
MTTAYAVTDPIVEHGETPTYDARSGRLNWVDMSAGDLLTMDVANLDIGHIDREQLAATITRRHVGEVAACWRPRRNGGAVIGIQDGFVLIDADGTLHPHPAFTDRALRMNDGGCDPQGRYYCGNMAYDETPGAGSVYRLDPDGSVTVVLSGSTISNGMVWSVDGTLVYYIDTPTGRIDVFDFDAAEGALVDRRPVVHIDPSVGHPDGMTIDAEGGLWVALWGGSAVRRYTADGQLSDVIDIPATQTTACAFGGPDLAELYITTSKRDIAPGEQPLAGSLFVAQPGVRGTSVLMFAG